MTNPFKGEVALKLEDGREYTLVFGFEAMVEVEVLTGKPAPQVMAEFGQGFLGAIRALLFGALRQRHPDITAVEVGDMIVSDSEAIGQALNAAVNRSLPDAGEDKQSGKAASRSGTMNSSGPNGAKRASRPTPSGSKPRARSR